MRDLSAAERKGVPGLQETATKIEALKIMEEEKPKKQERAERYGIVTKDMSEKRIKERQERFGIVTKESIETMKQERMKRFAKMTEMADSSTDGLS